MLAAQFELPDVLTAAADPDNDHRRLIADNAHLLPAGCPVVTPATEDESWIIGHGSLTRRAGTVASRGLKRVRSPAHCVPPWAARSGRSPRARLARPPPG